MATLLELQGLLNDPALRDRVRAAVVKTALAINFESGSTENHAARMVLAKAWLSDPFGHAEKVVRYVVGANAALTVAEINALTDAEVQSHVDASASVFI
jgi:hypothetical protein